MKDLFGEENMYEYLRFFGENHELTEEEIIEKYFEEKSGNKKDEKKEVVDAHSKEVEYIEKMIDLFGEEKIESYKRHYYFYSKASNEEIINLYIENKI